MPIISNFPSGGSLKISYTNGILAIGTDLPPTVLNDNSWATISAMSKAGIASNLWSVGDTKAVALQGTVGTLELDTTLYVYILGFDHNSALEGSGITFGTFKTAQTDGVDVCLITNYTQNTTDGTKNFNMNHWGSYNYGGWAACDLRYDILGSTDVAPSNYGSARVSGDVGYNATATCATSPVANTLMAALPSELRAVMKPMTKYTDNVDGSTASSQAPITATVDYLPLLSDFEVFGKRNWANKYEQNYQVQYNYYAAGNSKVKYQHNAATSTASWYLRSVAKSSPPDVWCDVRADSTGDIGRSSLGIAPIFKV